MVYWRIKTNHYRAKARQYIFDAIGEAMNEILAVLLKYPHVKVHLLKGNKSETGFSYHSTYELVKNKGRWIIKRSEVSYLKELGDKMNKVDSINKKIFEDDKVKRYNAMSFKVVKRIIDHSVREGFIMGVDYAMEELKRRLE